MTEHTIDPAILEAVQSIAYRFGVEGLEEMIVHANAELDVARKAYAELAPDSD